MNRTFENEMLAFALDGDTVQNLTELAAERWQMPEPQVLAKVAEAVARGELRLYTTDAAGTASDVAPAQLTPATLKDQIYTWMEATALTFERLRAHQLAK